MNDSMDEAITWGKKYLEDLLSFFGLNTEKPKFDFSERLPLKWDVSTKC